MFFLTLDLIGTAVFAYTGSVAARQQRFHLLGVLYISFLTAVGGGTLRGVLLQTPELFWMKSSAYFIVICAVVLVSYPIKINTNRLWFYLADSQSLAVFVALGIQQTLLQGHPLHIAFAMGVLSGIGGGLIRDAITSQPPQALSDPAYPIMMVAAALGGVLAIYMGWQAWTLACLAVFIVALVTVAINYHQSGRLVKYQRAQAYSVERSRPAQDATGLESLRSGCYDVSQRGSRIRKKPKSGLMALAHASLVIVFSCVAGYYYFNQSITDATASVSQGISSPVNTVRSDEKVKYLAGLHSISDLLNVRQFDIAEQEIINLRRNNFADHQLDTLSAKAVKLRVYQSALDQADMALAGDDTESLRSSIALASSQGFTDQRLEALQVGLKNLQERAAIEAANLKLAQKSFSLHLANAEYHLRLGNLDLAQREV